MPELPIIVEPTLRSYLLLGALGGGIVLTLLYGIWEPRKKRPPASAAIVASLPIFAFGIWIMLQPVGWYWRIDEKGMTLHAPFELFRSSGSVTWAEVTDIHIFLRPGRSMVYNQLEIDGQDGAVIKISGLDTMPKSFAAPLVAVFRHYAPQVRLSPGFADYFATVLGEPAAVPGSTPPATLALVSYRVRVGDQVLK
jgi:hypothetical protein